MKNFLIFVLMLFAFKASSQLGWNGNQTITAANTIVNRCAPVPQDIAQGSYTFAFAPSYSFVLCPSDLIMVYQAQGATMDTANTTAYGNILNYNSAGLYELKYVQSVNGTVVTVQTAFTNSYAASGKIQVVEVERYGSLTINNGAGIVPKQWKDTTIGPNTYRFGGIVAISATAIVNNGTISASNAGFRGGVTFYNNATYGNVEYKSTNVDHGAEKGEGIAGAASDYDLLGGRRCRGAAANGGGGGDCHNAAGGGGANGNNGNAWTGEGVMIVNGTNLLAAWALSSAYAANGNALTNSSGGGHGGYSFGGSDLDATLVAPGNPAWGGDSRREVGGIGGRPLTNINSESRIYFGGGGGAGDANNGFSASAGNGGGIVYLITNSVTGTGVISADGATAGNTTGTNNDAVSGGGGGGSIIVKTYGLVSTQTIRANGGKGGDQLFIQSESEGAGAGGGGGVVAISTGAVVPQVNGGINGTSFSNSVANELTSNGATQGATGQTLAVTPTIVAFVPIQNGFNISSNSPVCIGSTLSLTTNYPGPVYNWSGPNSFTSSIQNPTIAVTSTAIAGFYTLGGYAACGGGLYVVVAPQPTFAITGVQDITCTSPTVTLNASNNYIGIPPYSSLYYYWSSPSFTASSQSVDITAPGNYTCYMQDTYTGCAVQHTVSILLDQTPPTTSVNPVNQNILCGPGVVATVTGTAVNPTVNVTHSWYSPGIGVPVQGGGQYSIFGLGGPGTYTYVVTNNVNGCSTTKTVQVTSSLGYPVFNVTSPSPYDFTVGCSSTSLAVLHITDQDTRPLTGGSMSFAILPPGYSSPTYTYSSILDYTVSTPGNYTLIVQDNSNQCETRITVPIIQDIFPPDVLVNAATRTLTCRTPSTILEGVSTTTAVSYSWSFQNGANPNTVPNATTTATTTTNTAISATVVNVYTLTVTNENNQCKTTTLVPMYQNIRPPRPKINGAGPLDCINFEQTLVNGSTVDEAPGFFVPLGTAVTKWDGPSPQVPNEDTISSYKARTVGIYTMTVMDRNNGCITQTTVLVSDNRVYPTLQTNTQVALDCGASNSGVNLGVTAVGLKPTDVTAIWTTPLPVPDIKNANTLTLTTDGIGEYTLSVTTTSNGCSSQINVFVTNGVLTAGFTPDKDNGFAPLTVNFTNSSSSTSSITGTSSVTSVWSFGNGTTRTTTTNVVTSAVYNQPGTYTVTMFASKGTCSDTIVKVIHVDIPSKLEIPNIFTPNGDNSNDIFFVKAANLDEITALIYDRWGSKVYELTTDKGNIAWDGKNLQGKDSPDGTYYYIITAKGKDGQNYDTKGTITLVR